VSIVIDSLPENQPERTIQDFGEQWTAYPDNTGYYGSSSLFEDLWGPLAEGINVSGQRVADIGAGTGRFVNVFLDAAARHVLAIEPSDAMDVLKANTANRVERITYLQTTGDHIPPDGSLDYVFAIGVLHHIPDPLPVVVAARSALKPGAKFYAWVYGAEGNSMYVTALNAIRAVSTRVPHVLLVAIVWTLYWPLRLYIAAARIFPVPLRRYMRNVLAKLTGDKIRLVIYDQLNPAHAKYYTRDELISLFARAGYEAIELHHRHGYSWAVCATAPGEGR
jgi:SAM-dependent methyltransferase